MAFTRAKPAGWTDDVDTITATQINQIDVNQSRAIDGNAGGTYTPSGAIAINGSAGFSTGASNTLTTNGTLSIAGAATLAAGSTGIGARSTTQSTTGTVQGGAYEVVLVGHNLAGNITITLAATTPVPTTGKRVTITRRRQPYGDPNPYSAHTVTIDGLGGTGTVTFPISAAAFAEFVYTGSAWLVVSYSNNATIVD